VRARTFALLLTIALVACSTDAGTATTSPSADTSPAPTTTHAHVTTTLPGSSSSSSTSDAGNADLPAQLSADDLPVGAACALGTVSADGQTTFVMSGKLWAVDAEGAVSCLADLGGRNPSWISWSPDGDEVLVGPDTILRDDGTFVPTGYFPDNRALRWSAPTGKAFIAPNAQSGSLVWRNAHDSGERIDVSFMDRTTTAAYHPAGRHIAAAGTGSDGLGEGVFVASNRGANAQRVGQIDEGTVSDLAFEEDGNSIVFLHTHLDGTVEVHRYHLDLGFMEVVHASTDAPIASLVASPVDEGALAWSRVPSATTGDVWVQPNLTSTPFAVQDLPAGHATTPLSWLPRQRLVVAARTASSPLDAPYDVWQWSPNGTTHLIDGVSAAAARTAHGPYLELNIVQGSGFG
jgi:hypothetical protein